MAKQININVVGDPHGDVPVLLIDGAASGVHGTVSGSRAVFALSDFDHGGATIAYAGSTKSLRVIVPPSSGSWEADLPPVKPPEATGPIQLDYTGAGRAPILAVNNAARRIVNAETGERLSLRMHSDFRLFERFLRGEDIEAILADRRAIGSQGARVFACCQNLFHLRPDFYRDEQLRAFLTWMSDHGWMTALVACTDMQLLTPSVDPQWQLDRCCAVANGIPGVIVQAVNEWPQNGVNPATLHKPVTTALVTRGSSTGDSLGPVPPFDLADFHHRRDWKWSVTVPQTAAENAQVLRDCPEWGDEPIGIGNDGRNDRTTDAAKLCKMGVDAGMWMAGIVAHILAGLQSTPMPGEQVEPAKALFDGAKIGAGL